MLKSELILATQKSEYGRMSLREFDPLHTVRDDTDYRLPLVNRRGFLPGTQNFDQSLENFLHKSSFVRILDLGCGAGAWMFDQMKKDSRIEVFGITAKDYRKGANRPTVVFERKQGSSFVYSYKIPEDIVWSSDIQRDFPIDDDHYLVGDVHHLLTFFPPEFFHIVVSYEAFCYVTDPLRVLKLVYRTLKSGGLGLLQSFSPVIYEESGQDKLTDNDIQVLLKRAGIDNRFGEYIDKYDSSGRCSGLGFRKLKPRFALPLTYRSLEKLYDYDERLTLTYQLLAK